MKLRLLTLLTWIGCCCFSFNGRAAELEDFAGGVTTTRLTVNPASVATIDRFHTQYGAFRYEDKNLPRSTLYSNAQYDQGTVTFGQIGLAWPRQWGGLGLAYKTNLESYSTNRSSAENGIVGTVCYGTQECETPVSIDTLQHTAQVDETLLSALLGFAFPHVTVGLRASQRTLGYRYEHAYEFNVQGDRFQTDMTAEAQYTFYEAGILVPGLFSIFDVGLVYRPEVTSTASIPVQQSTDTNVNTQPVFPNPPSHVTRVYWDTDEYFFGNPVVGKAFTEPAVTLFGLGMTLSLGDAVALQVLGDSGSFTSTTSGLDGTQTGGSVSGQLIRFVIPPVLDISSGIQTQELGSLEIRKETNSIQFPFVEGTNLKIGSQTLTFTNLNTNTELANVTLILVSLNVQFGKPIKRSTGSRTRKRINFVDRGGNY